MPVKRHLKTLVLSSLLGLSGSGCCFVAGTRVSTPKGPQPIDSLKIGDEVWAWALETRARVIRRILAIQRDHAQVVCGIEVGERVISGVTPDHPFYCADTGEFVALRDLPADAPLLTLVDDEPREARLSNLVITEHPTPRVPVFNLTVQGPEHNYFAEGVLVHNKTPNYYGPTPDAGECRTDEDCALISGVCVMHEDNENYLEGEGYCPVIDATSSSVDAESTD